MTFSSSLLVAANVSEWFSGIWADYLAPRWGSFTQVFVGEDLLMQLGAIAGAVILSFAVTLGLRPLFKKVTEAIEERDDWIEQGVDWISDNLFRLLLVALLWSVSLYLDSNTMEPSIEAAVLSDSAEAAAIALDGGAEATESQAVALASKTTPVSKNYLLVRAAASIATLMLVSGALPRAIKQQVYFRTLFFVLAMVLILNLLGIWSVIREGLDGIALFPISGSGVTRVTLLTLAKGVVAISLLVPFTSWLIRTSESRVTRMEKVSPALQVLTIKVLKVLIAAGAIMFAISSVGVDLSAFAVLGGAIGLGLGFGFQKVVSNLISGVILLGDKSIKPGDVIEVDNTYGWINTLGARYTSVITRDGTEHLIPNEMMITEKVVNWSFSDEKVRVRIPFGVSYTSDIHKAMELALQAAGEDGRILKDPAAAVRLTGYGDNSVDFELRVWIVDPTDGLGNIRSAFYLKIWDLFKENGVEFPYPQRDVHLKELPPVEVNIRRNG